MLMAEDTLKKTFSTSYTKNIDRILKCLDKLRSNFYKLVNLRLTTITFWNQGFMTFNLKIIFQNCWQNNLINPILRQFTVNMYHWLTNPSQPLLVDVTCQGLPTENTWMLEQRETSKLKLFLTHNGCAHFGASKSLFLLSVALCFPSILRYNIRSKQIIEKFYNALRYFPLSLISFGSLKSKNSQKLERRILENSVQN